MRILVTGGSGLVGQYLQQVLDATYISSRDFDLTKEKEVFMMYDAYQPDVVVHLASKVGGIMDNIAHPFEYYEDNVTMNTYMIKYARKFNVKKFLGVLSSCAYPDVHDTYPLKETHIHNGAPNHSNFGYGYSKRMLACHIDIARSQGCNYSYIIPSNLYGEYEHGNLNRKHFVGALLEKIAIANIENKDHIVLFGDGTPLRQFTFAKDIADIIKLILIYDTKYNMNVSIEENLSINDIATLALSATNSTHLNVYYDMTKPNGQHRKDIDTTNFKNIFPNFEFTSYIEGLNKTYRTIIQKYGR